MQRTSFGEQLLPDVRHGMYAHSEPRYEARVPSQGQFGYQGYGYQQQGPQIKQEPDYYTPGGTNLGTVPRKGYPVQQSQYDPGWSQQLRQPFPRFNDMQQRDEQDRRDRAQARAAGYERPINTMDRAQDRTAYTGQLGYLQDTGIHQSLEQSVQSREYRKDSWVGRNFYRTGGTPITRSLVHYERYAGRQATATFLRQEDKPPRTFRW